MRPTPPAVIVGSVVWGAVVLCFVCYANSTGPQAERQPPTFAAPAPSAGLPSMTVAFQQPAGADQTRTRPAERQDAGAGFASVVSAVRPAVVTILRRGATQQHVSPASGPIFVDPYAQRGMRMGAGVIVDPRGYVLTSLQTISSETELWVKLHGAQTTALRAWRVAEDREADLAVLRVETGTALPALRLADSDLLKMGDLVLAIGSPFGFAEAVTTGIVSSNNRRLWLEGHRFDDLIQTDAQLNPGNAGGPLVNIYGEVVGIAVGMLAMNSTSVGIGFAVASNRARALLGDL